MVGVSTQSDNSVNARFGLGEWLLVEGLLHPGYRVAPGTLRWLRPLLVRAIWASAPSVRDALLRNARVLLDSNPDPRACRKFGLEVLGEIQRYFDDLVNGALGRNDISEAQIESEGRLQEYFDRREQGDGIVIATAHMGSFEAAASILTRLEKRVHVLYARDPSRSIERLRSRLRRRLGVVEHAVDDGLPTWRALQEALRNNEAVALPADRVQPGQPGFEVPLLGRPTMLPAGPFKLAMASGAPLVPVFCWRSPDESYRVSVGSPIEFKENYSRSLGTHEGIRKFVASFERVLRKHPTQWLMVFDAWPEKTSGSTA